MEFDDCRDVQRVRSAGLPAVWSVTDGVPGGVTVAMIELEAGESFAGYIIDRKLGAGGWGIVYLAQDPRLPRPVALKLLDPTRADPEAQQRFEHEGNFTARLDHPNIVTIFDRGVTGEIHWIAMQFVHGTDAGALRSVEPERAFRIGEQIADALDYAHRVGVLHRDVKPSNFLIAAPEPGRPERVLLTDFGIARLRDATTGLTRTGSVTGTAAYISPEQVSGGVVDHRSDQYSLACSLFVLLTGQSPFSVTDPLALAYAHVYRPPQLPGQLMPELAVLDPAFARALAKEPDDRFPSCREFLAEVRRAELEIGVAGVISDITAVSMPVDNVRPGDGTAGDATPENANPEGETPETRPREDAHPDGSGAAGDSGGIRLSRNVLLAAGVVVVILVVGAGLALGTDLFRGSDETDGSAHTVPGAASGWDDRHAPASVAFPGLIGGMNANTGWRGATCAQNDPGSVENPADHDYARISCTVPMGDSGETPLMVDIMDRAGSAHADLGLDELVSRLFSGCDTRPQRIEHDRQPQPPLVVTCAGTDYSRDVTHPPVWTFFPEAPYSRYVAVMTWKGHTINQILDQWRQVPLGR